MPRSCAPWKRSGALFLPLFFVVTGLSLNVADLNGTALMVLAVACATASAGKLGPAYLASRIGGLSAHDAVTVAVLVNTRGLTEIIALNIGLSAGLIDQRLFSVLVLMALIMTVVTAPLLSLTRAPAARVPVVDPRPATLPPSSTNEDKASN